MDSTPLPIDSTTRKRRKNVSNSASSFSQSVMYSGSEALPSASNNAIFGRESEKDTEYRGSVINANDDDNNNITSTNNLPTSHRNKQTFTSPEKKNRFDKLYNLFETQHNKRTFSYEHDKTSSDDNNRNDNNVNTTSDSNYNVDGNNNTESNRNRVRRNVLEYASSKVNVTNTSEKDAYGNDAEDTFIWKCRCSASILIAIAIWITVIMTIFLVISDSTKARETHALNAETAYNASIQHESYEVETEHLNKTNEPSSPSLHYSSSFNSSTSTPSLVEKRKYTNDSFHKNKNVPDNDHDYYHDIRKREEVNISIASGAPFMPKVNSFADESHDDAIDTEMNIHVCPHGSMCRERVYEENVQRKFNEQMDDYVNKHRHTFTDQESEDVEEVLPYTCKGRSCVENDANGLEFGIVQGSHDGVTAYSNCNYHSCYSFYDHVIEVHVHDDLKSMINSKTKLNENVNKAQNTQNASVTLNEPLPKRMSSGMKWQCVEYARRYWMLRGKPLPAYFESVYGAADIWNLNNVLLLDGTHIPLWKFANNGSIISPISSIDTQTGMFTSHNDPSTLSPFTSNIPNVGDLLLWERNVTADIPHGHVAVIVSVDEERHLIYVAEQNWDSSKWSAPHFNYSRSLVLLTNDEGKYVIQDDGLKLIGWVRYVVPESKLHENFL